MTTHELIGFSPRFQDVLNGVETVSSVECTVLLRGETGTGKEVVARAIHEASPRRHNRFVALNCAAIPAALLESELFGHERGAFTGACTQTTGRFQAADRGTLFLDEIGELPLELQPKLLRVLQEREFERLGSGRTQQVDVRVIAATNQDLRRMVQEGKFRADLYYRLNVYPVELPPLRERREDIPALAEYFVQRFAERHRKSVDEIPYDLMQALMTYDWPGNIRELQNFIERSVIMSQTRVLHSLMGELNRPALQPTSHGTLMDAERAHILATLESTHWVIGGRNGAAARLGLPRTTLIAKMKKLGISQTSREPTKVQRSDAEDYPFAANQLHIVEEDEAAGGSIAAGRRGLRERFCMSRARLIQHPSRSRPATYAADAPHLAQAASPTRI
jgi:formate hydrogenlyase transcriptional activator